MGIWMMMLVRLLLGVCRTVKKNLLFTKNLFNQFLLFWETEFVHSHVIFFFRKRKTMRQLQSILKTTTRHATTNYKFPHRYSNYLKQWEIDHNRKGQFIDSKDAEIDTTNLTSSQISKILSEGKKLPRKLISDDIYLKNLFQEPVYSGLGKALNKVRMAAKMDFLELEDLDFLVSFDLPLRKQSKAGLYTMQRYFIKYPNKIKVGGGGLRVY